MRSKTNVCSDRAESSSGRVRQMVFGAIPQDRQDEFWVKYLGNSEVYKRISLRLYLYSR